MLAFRHVGFFLTYPLLAILNIEACLEEVLFILNKKHSVFYFDFVQKLSSYLGPADMTDLLTLSTIQLSDLPLEQT